jgi:hypothetical protein
MNFKMMSFIHETLYGLFRDANRVLNAAGLEPGQSFDVAFLFGLARPIGDMGKIWSELHRLLKPEGTLSVEGRLRPPKELFQPMKRQGRISRYKRLG